MLKKIHIGYHGIIYWPGMSNEIRNYIDTCGLPHIQSSKKNETKIDNDRNGPI